jgi:magnesium chelatase family protein
MPDLYFSQVRGQEAVKRAITVALAGGHSFFLIGPAGSGKTMMLDRAVDLVNRLASDGPAVVRPHWTDSPRSFLRRLAPSDGRHDRIMLVVDCAHRFREQSLARLSAAVESGDVCQPRIWLMAAATIGGTDRTAMKRALGRFDYLGKAADLHVEAPEVPHREMTGRAPGTDTLTILAQVSEARQAQERRGHLNALAPDLAAKVTADLSDPCKLLLKQAADELGFNCRAVDRVLRIARTIADMDGSPAVAELHIAEAVQYRLLDRKHWG